MNAMEEQVALNKVCGNAYFKAGRAKDNAYICAHWFGRQSEETVKEGGYKLLQMINDTPCTKLLNSNKNVVGSWDIALEWAEKEWAPKMRAAGLRYLAQVVPDSLFATHTIVQLLEQINGEFTVKMFKSEKEAEAWLLSRSS